MKTVLDDRIEWTNDKGELHREDGPAIEYKNGSKEWWLDGKLHRLDGPAVEYKHIGRKEWYINGFNHRLDGPAIMRGNGDNDWFINGTRYRNKELWFNALSLEDQIAYLFKMES